MRKKIDLDNIYDKFNNKLNVGDKVYFPFASSSYSAHIDVGRITRFEYRGGYLCAIIDTDKWCGHSVKKIVKV